MGTPHTTPTTIDEYIALFPLHVQEILQKIRLTVRQAAPEAEETIETHQRTGRPWGDAAFIERLENETGRVLKRQKPGPKNSLGLVKFMFPNEYDVYMHSTPEMNLFNLSRRDRSHGCVRLNDAEKMANWVLNGQGAWDGACVSGGPGGERAGDRRSEVPG